MCKVQTDLNDLNVLNVLQLGAAKTQDGKLLQIVERLEGCCMSDTSSTHYQVSEFKMLPDKHLSASKGAADKRLLAVVGSPDTSGKPWFPELY